MKRTRIGAAVMAFVAMVGIALSITPAQADVPPIPAQCQQPGGCTQSPIPPAMNYYASVHTAYGQTFEEPSVEQAVVYPAGTCTNCGYDVTTAYGVKGTAGARLGRNVYQADGNWVEYVSDNSGAAPAPGVAIFQSHTAGKTNGELIFAANGGISIRDRTTGAVLYGSPVVACTPPGVNECRNDFGSYGNGHFIVSRWSDATQSYTSVWNQ